MKKLISKIILKFSILIFGLIPLYNQAFSVDISLPDWTRQDDLNIPRTRIDNRDSTLLNYIKLINNYLRFIIIWLALFWLIYAGILLITSSWDKKKLSWAKDIALVCIIAIVISMLSYFVVKLIVNLF